MDDPIDRVSPDKIPRINRGTTVIGIAWHACGIEGSYAAVSQRSAGRTTVQQGLINVDAFFVLRGCAIGCVRSARTGKHTVAGVIQWWRQNAVIRHVVEYSD